MQSRLGKILVLTVTVLAVAFATLCVAGRIVAWRVPHHEQAINQWFSSHGIQVEGPRLRWAGLNAIVEFDKLTSHSVDAHSVRLELDFLRSLWRNHISLAALEIEDLQFALERTSEGWASVGADSSSGDANVLGWLWNASSVNVQLQGTLTSGEVSQRIEGAIQTKTERGLQHSYITLQSPQACDQCGLHMHVERRKSIIFSDDVFALEVRAIELSLEPSLWGFDYLRAIDLNGTLSVVMRNNVGKARLVFDLQGLDSESGSVAFSGELIGSVVKDEAHGVIRHSAVSLGPEKVPLPDLHGVVRTQPFTTHVWMLNDDSRGIVELVRGFAEPTHALHKWVTELSPSASVELFQAAYDQSGLTMRTVVEDLRTQSFGAVPSIRAEAIELTGKGRNILIESRRRPVEIEFETLFDDAKLFDQFDGSMLIAFTVDGVGVRLDMPNAQFQDSHVEAKFGFFHDSRELESSLGVAIRSDGFDVGELQGLVPTNIPDAAQSWLETNIRAGRTFDTQVVVQSIMLEDFEARPVVVEAYGRLAEVEVSYDSNWPILNDLSGELWLSREALEIAVESTHSQGIAVNSGRVFIPFDESEIEVSFAADSPATLALDFVRSTPLREALKFDTRDYSASGPLDIEASMRLSANGVSSLDVSVGFVDVDIDLARIGMGVQDLSGTIRFASPFEIVGTGLNATLFDREVDIQIDTTNPHDDDAIVAMTLNGKFSPENISPLVGEWLTNVASGESEFRMQLKVATGGATPAELFATSDLQGIHLNLPHPFGKEADEVRPSNFVMHFEETPTVRFESGEMDSLFLLKPNSDPIGSIGLNVPPHPITSLDSGLHVTGSLEAVVVGTQLAQGGGFPSDLTIRELSIQKVEIDALSFANVRLDGHISGTDIDLTVHSDELIGTAKRSGEGRLAVDIDRLQISENGSDEEDPLKPEITSVLPDVDLSIEDIVIVDNEGTPASYGSWSMAIDVDEHNVSVSNLRGVVRGLTIEGQVAWDTSANSSNFVGSVHATKLQDVLEQWDYDPNVESESVTVAANLSWLGSPLYADLYSTRGSLVGDLEDGRFIDVNAGGGALRIIGLLSFTAMLDRLRLNFRDVFGEGTRFNRILFVVDLEEGVLKANQPVVIKTNGPEVSFAGDLDMKQETVEMEVVVTLPVAGSIPWYVALATGSPVAVITTLAAKKLFEGQIDQMSSSKYRITGTIDDPKIELIGVFRDSLDPAEEESEDQPVPMEESDQ